MVRTLSFAAALAASAVSLFAAAGPAHAQSANAAFYVATPEAAAVDGTRTMTRATGWTFRDGRYLAARAPERSAVLCDLLARDVGRLTAFSAGKESFGEDDLAKCNRRAKASSGTAVAAR